MGAATQKWIALAIDLAAYEAEHWHDEEMLTFASHRLVGRHPVAARMAIISAGALLTAHLARIIDARYDPLSKDFFLRNRFPGLVDPR